MLAFIIPLKSAQVSSSWDLVCKLFERTLRSVCNQTSSEYHVIIVCHEKPDVDFKSDKVTYIQVDFPLPGSEYVSKEKDRRLKVQAGLLKAKVIGASHIMVVDADDCVSKHIVEFVTQNSAQNGWFISKGYDYQEDMGVLRIRNKNLHLRTGSSHIIKLDLLEPEMSLSPDQIKISNSVLNHVDTARILKERGTALTPLPFRGVIYVTGNGENIWWGQNSVNNVGISFKQKILVMPKFIYQSFIRRPVDQKISDDFMLYDITD